MGGDIITVKELSEIYSIPIEKISYYIRDRLKLEYVWTRNNKNRKTIGLREDQLPILDNFIRKLKQDSAGNDANPEEHPLVTDPQWLKFNNWPNPNLDE